MNSENEINENSLTEGQIKLLNKIFKSILNWKFKKLLKNNSSAPKSFFEAELENYTDDFSNSLNIILILLALLIGLGFNTANPFYAVFGFIGIIFCFILLLVLEVAKNYKLGIKYIISFLEGDEKLEKYLSNKYNFQLET